MTTALAVETESETEALREEILQHYEALAGQGHAETLGLEPHPSAAEIKAAYASLARRFHPDRATFLGDDVKVKVQAVFIRITEASRALLGEAANESQRRQREKPRLPQQAIRPPQARPLPQAEPGPAVRAAAVAERPPADPKAAAQVAVERAIAEAEDRLGHDDPEAAIAALHPVVIRAEGRLRERVRLVLARAYTKDARYKTYAVRLLREMLQDKPDDAEALVLQASLFRREGLLARAESTLRRALASDPGHAEAKHQLRAVTAARQRSGVPQVVKPTRTSGLLARLLARRA